MVVAGSGETRVQWIIRQLPSIAPVTTSGLNRTEKQSILRKEKTEEVQEGS